MRTSPPTFGPGTRDNQRGTGAIATTASKRVVLSRPFSGERAARGTQVHAHGFRRNAPSNSAFKSSCERALSNVVLLHGLGGSGRATWVDSGWVDILQAEGHTVSAPDLLGHGRADKPLDPAAYVDMHSPLRHALGDVRPLIGVGFSLGARVLLDWALDDPSRFDRLVLLGLGDNAFREDDVEVFARALESADTPESAFLARMIELSRRAGNDPAALATLVRGRRTLILDPQSLGQITVATLVVMGDDDPVGDPEPLVASLGNGALRRIRKTDHFNTVTSVDVIDAVVRFCE